MFEANQKRYLSIDVIRGIALLGITMLNALLIAYPQHFYKPIAFPLLNQADIAVELTLMLFIRTSFYPIFSFLFGVGFALQFSKLKQRSFFIRRYGFLLILGLLHGCFVWMGDILFLYAVAGFLLLFLTKLNRKNKIVLAAILTVGSLLLLNYGVNYLIQHLPLRVNLEQLVQVYAAGGFWEVTQLRSYEYFYFGVLISLVYVLPQVLALFLLGIVAVESGFFDNSSFSKYLLLAFTALALLKLPRVYFAAFEQSPAIWRYLSVVVGGPTLGGIYVLAIVRGMMQARASSVLSIFASVGRMALTNYLSQSIILTTIFYGYGLGQYASWGSLNIVLLAISLFTLQMIVSTLWLNTFRYGPMEWLWRSFCYGRFVAIK